MNNLGCSCKCGCTVLSVIASIIIGFITALLRITGIITLTPAFLWVLLGVSVVYLGILLLKQYDCSCENKQICLCPSLSGVLTGILGTVLTSVILLGIEFAVTSIPGAVISGALLLFFSLIITSSACLVKCSAKCSKI